jgi:predicted nuclease of restriction endonuclease-like (RecB) superfamily
MIEKNSFVDDIKQILGNARQKAYSAINSAMVEAYWFVGKRIVEEEQQGEKRAEYGKEVLKTLSKELTADFGKGFSDRNIRNFRQFYLSFPKLLEIQKTPSADSQYSIWQTASAKLSWSHFLLIMRVSNKEAQAYYLKEAAENIWSVRTLDRNISTLYYQRLLASQIKEPVVNEMLKKTEIFQDNKFEFIKNPTVLEFLNLPANTGYTELELEKALIDNIQNFLLELGKGFAFVARQKLIRTETSDFYIDLVFYNYILNCFVIIDLKTDKITHQDVGQLDMYVRIYDDLQKQKTDNPTIGILLCTETDRTIAKYSVLKENKQLFASKYMAYLPTEEELIAEIEREKLVIKQQLENEK